MQNFLQFWKAFSEFWNNLGWLANLIGICAIVIPIGGGVFALLKKIAIRRGLKSEINRYKTYGKMDEIEYKNWLQAKMESIYSGSEFVTLYNKKYPAIIHRSAIKFEYPFTDLCELSSTEIPSITLDKVQKNYLLFLGNSVKRPKMKGFATKEIIVDEENKVKKIIAHTITYEHNLVTSHILEWELFKAYKKHKKYGNELINYLEYRKKYHGEEHPSKAILRPYKSFPLISLHALIIYKDYKIPQQLEWKAIVAERQKNVATKPNVWQIQPAGGFEIYGHEDDHNEIYIKNGFSIIGALFRELAEEIYNAEQLIYCKDSSDPENIFLESHIA